MKKLMYYNLPCDERITRELNAHKIKYKVASCFPGYIQFYIYQEDEAWQNLRNILPKKNVLNLVFTDEELLSAKWLTLRTTNMKIDSMSDDTYTYICPGLDDPTIKPTIHRKQVAPFVFKPIKWKPNNHFYSPYLGGYHKIICDDFAMNFFKKQGFKGVSFKEIFWYKKGIQLPDAHQIVYDNVLPESTLVLDEHVRPISCQYCDKIQYAYTNDFQLGVKESFLDADMDFYVTPEIFGHGCIYSIPIVSGRVYRALKEAQMTRNLCFEPVILY